MDGYLLLLLFALVGAVKARNSVNGWIEGYSTIWFLSDHLSVVPAMRATIEYDIWYPYLEHYEDHPPYITFYYTGQNSPNLRFQCNKEMHGQLYNNLAIQLNEDDRENKSLCESATTFGNSHGRIEIQDFDPKTYFFSLGFECGYQPSLDCFQYNVTIYDESNTTRCVDLNVTSEYSDMSQQSLTDQCKLIYQYAAIPNQFGDTDLDGALSRTKKLLPVKNSDDPREYIIKNLKPFLCEIVLPKCLPEENKIILPCREDCKFYLEGYLKEIMNCDYLPPCEGRNSVIGSIKDNTTWFLSNLSVRPTMTASIKYNIQYPNVPGHHRPIITFYYNGQNSPNLRDKCNSEMHGQLSNKDLAVPLNGKHREKFWCNRKGGMKVCHGRTKIQDFEPKSYFFSLGFECSETSGNLNGLQYEVTIYDESNKASCMNLNLTQGQRTDLCELGYQYVAFPNQVGHTDLDEAISYVESFQREFLEGKTIASRYVQRLNKGCLKKLKQFLCQIFLPKCLPKENEILLPCRDTCKSLMENCSLSTIHGMEFNCRYLPPCPPTYPNYLDRALRIGTFVMGAFAVVTFLCVLIFRVNKKETNEPRLPRNRAFDAFVLYHFDSDHIYVIDNIIPELEEVRKFKLHVHSRNFTPGRDIKDNIEEAIEGSNSAILLMSQGFVDSMWCKEEFIHCYIENMKDAAFNLFVIMMQPADTLVNISNYMKTFFVTKTYLDVNDPELFTKLATLLDEARQPANDDVDNHNNDNNDNIASDDETQEIEDTNV